MPPLKAKAPNERLDRAGTLKKMRTRINAMTIRDLLYELGIEDIRKRNIFKNEPGSAKRTSIPVALPNEKLEQLVKDFLTVIYFDGVNASEITAEHMGTLLKSRVL